MKLATLKEGGRDGTLDVAGRSIFGAIEQVVARYGGLQAAGFGLQEKPS
jgi:hypothetical protein